ncbi:MAB_1171c family putative transporter [Streptomyces sp. TRM 70351]|uniref:MAB_1171c family putative transporter n=1 Tax=Streptomyces sp. TRM 70351 TaxID=3116552 RepID=UPI002E7AB6C9|nr:MAB_1171c family putative transporter [Streptomyces sp. TRM 70351]MEE1929207.1 MAB_1171c family putative transporter [Streptomyces sp. TRM 70351]
MKEDPSALYWTCSAAAWTALAFKVRDLWKAPRNAMRWSVCATLLLAGTAMFFAAPTTIAHVNRLSGIPNLAAPLVYSLLTALSVSAHVLIAYWRHPADRARPVALRWIGTYAAVIAALVVLFALGDTPQERRTDFDTHYATTPYTCVFIVLYLVALAVAMTVLIREGRRWAAVAGRPWLRRGLRFIVAGAAGALGFCLAKLAAVAARWTGRDWDPLNTEVAPALAVLGLLCSALGYALPAWGEQLTALSGRLARHRAYRDLYPLWDALRRATPAIVPPVRVPWWDFELRLTRRLAEINDGRLALRSHTDPRAGALALRRATGAGLTGTELHAAVDAARLRAAVAAKAAGRTYPHDTATGPAGPYGGVDGVGELEWLVRVSRAFAASPVVRAAADEAARDGGDLTAPTRNRED